MEIRLENVRKRFGASDVIVGANARFLSGRVHCITGENGSGKTTLLNLIGGQSRPDGGQIVYGGQAVPYPDSTKLARLGVARLFQQTRLFEDMSVLDNVLVAFRNQLGESLLRSAIAPMRVRNQGDRLKARALDLLGNFGVHTLAERAAGTLSVGQSKLVAFARLAARQPCVLLLDEPTAGVSRANQVQLLRWIESAKAEGANVLVVEHDHTISSQLGDRFYHIEDGQLLERSCSA